MSQHAAIPPQWPADVVRVTYTAHGVLLHFPALRGWRGALKLALIGVALFVPSLYAAVAFAPSEPDAATLLTLALTAAVVYPVLLFGAWFVLVALYAVANSLTVEVDANAICAVRRLLGFRLGKRCMPASAIGALEAKTAVAPRGLGGNTYYRLVARAAADQATGNPRAARMIIADGVPDETLLEALKALIARYAQLDQARR
jgi:hypothetical protein